MHFLSRDDGTFVARMKTDGSPITAAPVLAGETLVVQTHDGDLYGYPPALIAQAASSVVKRAGRLRRPHAFCAVLLAVMKLVGASK